MPINEISLGQRVGYRLISGDNDGKQADATVLLGGRTDKFVPNINAFKWASPTLPNGEAWLNINFPQVVGLERPTFDGKLLTLMVGDYLHRWYDLATGELEYEIILLRRPPTNRFTLVLDFSPGLEFWWQAPLANVNADGSTWEITSYGRRSERPAWASGSYAVYWKESNNVYKTGKFCHFQRPRLTDALGRSTYAALSIDPIAKTLTISVAPAWLAAAAYPVVIDPTIGYTTAGASTAGDADYIQANTWSAGTTGDANPGTAFFYGQSSPSSGNVVVGAYANGSANPGGTAKLAASGEITITAGAAAWFSGAITWTGITSGTSYWITENLGGGESFMYEDTGPPSRWYAVRTYDGTLPATWPASPSKFNRKISMYIEYTAGGAAQNKMKWGIGMGLGGASGTNLRAGLIG